MAAKEWERMVNLNVKGLLIVTRTRRVAVNEILVRPTEQEA